MIGTKPGSEGWIGGTCKVGAVEIHYLRTGIGRPTVVALHGLTGSGACWTAVARAFEDEVDVVMPDARGHGASSAPAHGYSYRYHASDVLGLVEALEITAPVLLGHSMGGMTAAVVASELGPAIRGVVLADPTFLSPEQQSEVFESDVASQHRQLLRCGRSELLADLGRRHPGRSQEMIELLADARLQTSLSAFEVLTPPNPDYRDLIRRIRVPIHLVIGNRGVVSAEMARELRGLNPRLSYEVIQDAGHGVPYDQPERLAVSVRSFVRSLPETAKGD